MRAIMFHVGRCGSTVLGDMLSQHSQIFWGAEIYHHLFWNRLPLEDIPKEITYPTDPFAHFVEQAARCPSGKIYGCEVKTQHRVTMPSSADPLPAGTLVRYFRIIGVSKFILLERRNVLRRIVSGLSFRARDGELHTEVGQPRPTVKIQIPIEAVALKRWWPKPLPALIDFFARDTATMKVELSRYPDIEPLFLSYEDDVEGSPAVGYQKICRYFGVSEEPVLVRFQKVLAHLPLTDIIENFDEVAACLKGTPSEWMLYA